MDRHFQGLFYGVGAIPVMAQPAMQEGKQPGPIITVATPAVKTPATAELPAQRAVHTKRSKP